MYMRMMCIPREPKGKVGKGRVTGSMNRGVAFLSLLLWEGHHSPPLPLSLIPYSVRNSFAYAETVIRACTGRPANAKLYQCLWIYLVPKHPPSRWMVYLFVIFVYSVLVTLPSNYRDHMFVSPFLRHLCVLLQWTNAICPRVRLKCTILFSV